MPDVRDASDARRPGAVEWVGLVVLILVAAMSGLLELMFLAQWYAGSVILPFTILAAVAGNLLLPRWGNALVGGARGAVFPFAAWLIVTIAPALYNRPEGDLFVLGTYGQNIAFYGLLLGGAIAGFATIIVTSTRPR